MDGVSVLIPARNEIYLEKTLRSILDAAKGEIEIIAVLDGYLPDPPIEMNDDRVKFLHFEQAVGQRHAINAAAKEAKGKFILKTDAHSMFDQGFDVKLAADCEYDWTVIPRMYNLDVNSWEPKKRKRTDFMWIRSWDAEDKPFRHNYWDGPCATQYKEEYKIHKEMDYRKGDICDVMTGQGACFFMHKDRFWDLGGCDEGHGSWGQQGVEVALKAWLSGGALKVNKKTWFSHWFRGGNGPGFPYEIKGSEQHKARKYSMKFWKNPPAPFNKRDMEWLVKKFAPLPTWKGYTAADMNGSAKILKKPRPELKSVLSSSLWICKGREFDVKELHRDRILYADPKKLEGLKILHRVFPPMVEAIFKREEEIAVKRDFTDKDLMKFEYYDYLVSRLNPKVRREDGTATRKGRQRCLNLIRDLQRLCRDIKANGLRSPLDMYMDGPHPVLTRGARRLEIIYQIGWDKVPVRIWRNHWLAHRYIGSADWQPMDDSIHGVAVKQFNEHLFKSTDKYRVHNYTPYYDFYMRTRQGKHLKILELGVLGGMSIKLWHDAFLKSQIYGVDKNLSGVPQEIKDLKRVHLFEFDLYQDKNLEKFAKEHGPWDMIVDDALHTPGANRFCFDKLWKHLNPNGVFVIEDTHHNYREKYKEKNMMPKLKRLIDSIWTDHKVQSVSFYPNIIFIRKA